MHLALPNGFEEDVNDSQKKEEEEKKTEAYCNTIYIIPITNKT
jgi:hypothetical protein